jgi:hypothetical protein
MAILNFSVERCCEVFSSPVFHEDSKSGLRIGRRLLEHGLIVCEKSPILLRQILIFEKYIQFITFLHVGRLNLTKVRHYVTLRGHRECVHQRLARLDDRGFEPAFVRGLDARDALVGGLAFGFGCAFDFADFADPINFADFAFAGFLFGFGLLSFERRPAANTGSCVDAAIATSRSSFAIVFVPR